MAKVRNRDREDAGIGECSWMKHGHIYRAAVAQWSAFRSKNHKGLISLIDLHAGDGSGVEEPQSDFFATCPRKSKATAQTLADIANLDLNAELLLCEIDPTKREKLRNKFPEARIIDDHKYAAEHISQRSHWALVISDPCGPKDQGVKYMREIRNNIRADFVVAFNEGALDRMLADLSEDAQPRIVKAFATMRERYAGMLDNEWWLNQLDVAHLAKSTLIKQSQGFQYKLLIAARYLSDVVKRKPFEVVI